jgi:hypothetical protein
LLRAESQQLAAKQEAVVPSAGNLTLTKEEDMSKTIRRIFPVVLIGALAAHCNEPGAPPPTQQTSEVAACAPPPPPILTFSRKLASKMFISTIGPVNCTASTGIVVPVGIAGQAAMFAFCALTDLQMGENPPNDANVAPLDARVLSIGRGSWQCQAGNAAPFGGTWVTGGSVGGPEGPFVGIANNPGIRDNINLNGTYGFVSSGHPNPLVEPSFQAQRLRARTDIWDKTTGAITCGVDARGQPTSTTNFAATFTRFPQHKIWTHTPSNAVASRLLFNNPQGLFSNLWWLPAIPAP